MKRFVLIAAAGLLLIIVLALLLLPGSGPQPGKVRDEAMIAGRPASSFPAADEDYFKDMDNGVQLSADEVKGRNMWLVWSGGNDRFWDVMIKHAFGTFDLLKTISSAPGLAYSRENRWNYFGVINEPCFDKPTAAGSEAFRALAGPAANRLSIRSVC